MTRKSINPIRRSLLKLGAIGGLTPVLAQLSSVKAAEQLKESDPVAQQLQYVHDATLSTNSKRQPEQVCNNCQLLQAMEGEDWGGCPLFADKLVNAKGWCSAWVPKPG